MNCAEANNEVDKIDLDKQLDGIFELNVIETAMAVVVLSTSKLIKKVRRK